jgi:hypothetical protein
MWHAIGRHKQQHEQEIEHFTPLDKFDKSSNRLLTRTEHIPKLQFVIIDNICIQLIHSPLVSLSVGGGKPILAQKAGGFNLEVQRGRS